MSIIQLTEKRARLILSKYIGLVTRLHFPGGATSPEIHNGNGSQIRNQLDSINMADTPIDCDFPVWGLMPKRETGVVSFLNKYGKYDGRDTIIAIFDSGVDPAAAGLQVTSTGETKVIERYDCSGCGDVDTTTVLQANNGQILGLTGRKLTVPQSWKNPSGNYRLGVVYPFSLYPAKLKERVQEHRRHVLWDSHHKLALAKANKDLQEFDEKNSGATLSAEDKLWKEELESRIDVLQTFEKKYTDIGPAYDCVLFHDGIVWRACIDTSEKGDLENAALLGEYSVTYEHTYLTTLDQMTVSINVHNEGDTLEVVGMCSTHGTHVASIAAGNFPEDTDRNGIAPGAKIVSLTIGDSRLGSMETGTALVRACVKVMELSKKMKIDVINMSYGEHAHWANTGRVGDMICEVVNRYGVSWVVSAGNHGPALCTVGSPPDIAQPILIGVGAYVSADMMRAAYSMRARLPSTAFSWSSRGPCADGAAGVSVVAPGGAVTSVARFTLRGSQLMNGTSMAAPHVAGAVAILISGLKEKKIAYSPYSIKRIIENTATNLDHVEPWAQGCGLLNVERAFDNFCSHRDQAENNVTFLVSCGTTVSKGIHIRGKDQNYPRDIIINVETQFLENHKDEEETESIPAMIDFNIRLALTCGATWVQCPSYLDMMNACRSFTVRVDPQALQPGAHFTSILAYDIACIEKGPVFRIPVTVIRPEPLHTETTSAPSISCTDVTFRPGEIKRHFVLVPAEATWAVLKLNTTDKERIGRFLVHAMHVVPKKSIRSHEHQKMINVTAQTETQLPFQVVGDMVLEVAIAKYWANLGDLSVDYSLEFRGIRPDFGSTLSFHGADGVHCVRLTSLRQEECAPTVQLKYSEQILRPSDSKLTALSARDIIPKNRPIYQLINTYNFHLAKNVEVCPNVSLLSDLLYESEFESQMWMLFNNNKQLMSTGDAYPSKYSVKLEKGDYVVRLSVRHEQRAMLEKLAELPLLLQQKLLQPLPLDAYSSHSQALTGGKKLSFTTIGQGAMMPVYINALSSDKVSRSNLSVGHLFTGTVSFSKDELGKKVDTYTVKYVIPEPPKRNNAVTSTTKDKDRTKAEEYAEALKDFKLNWMAKLEGEKLEQVYSEVSAEQSLVSAHVAYLGALYSNTDPRLLPKLTTTTTTAVTASTEPVTVTVNNSPLTTATSAAPALAPTSSATPDVTTDACQKVLAITDKVIAAVPQSELLAYLGIKNDTRVDAAKIRIEKEKVRNSLVDALSRRGVALCRLMALTEGTDEERTARLQDIAEIMQQVCSFADAVDPKVIHFSVWHSYTLQHWGRAVKLLVRLSDERGSRELDDRMIELSTKLGWQHYANHLTRALPSKYPSTYRLF